LEIVKNYILKNKRTNEDLNPAKFNLKDDKKMYNVEGLLNIYENNKKKSTASLLEIQNRLKELYSNKIAYQFSHLEVKYIFFNKYYRI
jgi:2-oxoglutarate dehydrogenase complex dehydrogenase (E1) component-like enzyme